MAETYMDVSGDLGASMPGDAINPEGFCADTCDKDGLFECNEAAEVSFDDFFNDFLSSIGGSLDVNAAIFAFPALEQDELRDEPMPDLPQLELSDTGYFPASTIRSQRPRSQNCSRFNSHQLKTLKAWFAANASNPYTDTQSLTQLCRETNLAPKQIRNCLNNYRRRYLVSAATLTTGTLSRNISIIESRTARGYDNVNAVDKEKNPTSDARPVAIANAIDGMCHPPGEGSCSTTAEGLSLNNGPPSTCSLSSVCISSCETDQWPCDDRAIVSDQTKAQGFRHYSGALIDWFFDSMSAEAGLSFLHTSQNTPRSDRGSLKRVIHELRQKKKVATLAHFLCNTILMR